MQDKITEDWTIEKDAWEKRNQFNYVSCGIGIEKKLRNKT